MMQTPAAVLTLMALLAGCESRTYGKPPPAPPAPPAAPAPPVAVPTDLAEAAPVPDERAGKAARARDARTRADSASRNAGARSGGAASKPPATPLPAAPAEKAATPAAKTPAPAREAKGSVRVPQSEHVRIELPSGLQADLDHDPRMQPWVNKAVSAIERCYAPLRDAGTSGVIEVRLVMHENERPSAEPGKLPTALTPMLACVTGDMMRTKMPLFTGKEGTRYTLKIRLAK